MRSAARSAYIVLASFEYTTAPPLKNSLAPPCAVRTAARSPPVHDSATAIVVLRRRRRAWIARMRSSSSASVGGCLGGTEDESEAGDDRQPERRREDDGRRRRERRGPRVRGEQGHRGCKGLEDGLCLAFLVRWYCMWLSIWVW